jgi:hypothetical protein
MNRQQRENRTFFRRIQTDGWWAIGRWVSWFWNSIVRLRANA